MTSSDTAPAKINPDPTKWRDRIAEFRAASGEVTYYAVAPVVGALVCAGASVLLGIKNTAFDAAFIAVTSAAFCGASVVRAVAATIDTVARGDWFSHKPVQPRPLARKLGFVFSGLAALAAGGFTAYTIGTLYQPPAPPVSTAPDVIFNATAQDCKSERVRAAINKIKADGFPVTCANPAP